MSDIATTALDDLIVKCRTAITTAEQQRHDCLTQAEAHQAKIAQESKNLAALYAAKEKLTDVQ